MMPRLCFALAIGVVALTAYAAESPEDVFWNSVKKSDVLEEYRIYAEQYPRGKYIGEAWRRVGAIEALEVQKAEEAKRRTQVKLIADR